MASRPEATVGRLPCSWYYRVVEDAVEFYGIRGGCVASLDAEKFRGIGLQNLIELVSVPASNELIADAGGDLNWSRVLGPGWGRCCSQACYQCKSRKKPNNPRHEDLEMKGGVTV